MKFKDRIPFIKINYDPHALLGLLLIALFACTATMFAEFDWIKALKFSPLIVGIVIGMLFANTLRGHVPATWNPGISFAGKQILRLGIVLYGFRVTIGDVCDVGIPAITIDAIIVAGTLVIGILLGKLFKMDSQTALLTSVGSSICGAAAVLGADPVVKSEPHKVSVAVSTVVIFGTIAMFLYPACFRADLFDMTPRQVGIYTGATLHEVAHVYGAGEAIEASIGEGESVPASENAVPAESAESLGNGDNPVADSENYQKVDLNSGDKSVAVPESENSVPAEAVPATESVRTTAVIVKMIRVIMLAPVLILLSVWLKYFGRSRGAGTRSGKIQVPMFAFYFLAVIVFNSYVPVPAEIKDFINNLDTFLLTMAMTALGVDTSFDKFKKAGLKPFLLAGTLFIWLIFGGYWLVKWIA